MATGVVYAARDPATGTTLYVGSTITPLRLRARRHRYERGGLFHAWLRAHRAAGGEVEWCELERVDVAELRVREQHWIAQLGPCLNERRACKLPGSVPPRGRRSYYQARQERAALRAATYRNHARK